MTCPTNTPKRRAISIDDARRLYDYDPETGCMTFKERQASDFPWHHRPDALAATFNRKKAGKTAYMSPYPNGYLRVSVLGKSHLAHRFAWFLHTGEWPSGVIDHINGDRSDNRIGNLRDVSPSENASNRRPGTNSQYELTGISLLKDKNVYVVSVIRDGQQLPTKWCKTLEEAMDHRVSMGFIPHVQKEAAKPWL